MLPLLHFQRYQEFRDAVEQMRKVLAGTDLPPRVLRESFHNVQQLFQSQITMLSADEVGTQHVARWQSLQTEIYRQMRLLETDIMLLLSSRTPATSQRRVLSVRDRLNTLIQYCEALLQL